MDNYTWERDGLIIRRGFMPDDLIDAYLAERGRQPVAYTVATPYMDVPSMRDLCLWSPLTELLAELISEDPLLHLNLTNFRSTTRDFHADSYLNPPHVGPFYLATWMALGDIDPDAGPFEFVPGSHLWPESTLTMAQTFAMASDEEKSRPDWAYAWPRITERVVVPYFEEAMKAHGNPWVHRFAPASKGDLLVWSPYLIHRGSVPNNPDLERPALISHYSGREHRRIDMPSQAAHHAGRGWYALLNGGPA